jgi:CRISPR-associated protein Cas6
MSITGQHVEIRMRIRGRQIPLDHGYLLFAGLSALLPELRERPEWSVLPVRGRRRQDSLELRDDSRIAMRVPLEHVLDIVSVLPDRPVRVGQHDVLLGAAEIVPILPAPLLRSRIVTIKGYRDDLDAFQDQVRQRLGEDAVDVAMTLGPRRVMRAGSHIVVGWAVELAGLGDEVSKRLQCHGIGGRRHMGAGVFIAPRRSDPVTVPARA